MTVFGSSGLIETGPTSNDTQLIATVPARSYVAKIDVQGVIAYVGSAFGLASGLYSHYNLAAGIQYGQQGYTPRNIIDATAGGASWIAYGMLLPVANTNTYAPGLSPQNITQAFSQGININWRQLWYAAIATDIYLAVGCDFGRSDQPTFQLECTYNVEWATYP